MKPLDWKQYSPAPLGFDITGDLNGYALWLDGQKLAVCRSLEETIIAREAFKIMGAEGLCELAACLKTRRAV